MRIAKTGYIVVSVILCLSGVLFITLPDISIRTISRMLGATMALFGCIKLIGYFSKDLFRLAFQYDLQFGIISLILGIIVLLKPSDVVNLLFAALGIALLADSLFKIQISFDSRKFGIRKWWGILALAIISGIVAIVLMLKPSESARALIILLGAAIIAGGILNLFVAITTVKIIKHQYPDFIEDEYMETEDENR